MYVVVRMLVSEWESCLGAAAVCFINRLKVSSFYAFT